MPLLAALAACAWAVSQAGRTPLALPATAPALLEIMSETPGLNRPDTDTASEIGLASYEGANAATQSYAGTATVAERELLTSDTGSDEDRSRRALGHWEDDYRGKRHLTVRADGTATMHVEPAGALRKLFGEKLEFQIEWMLEKGKLTMTTLAGEPKAKTQLILKLYGNQAEYTVLGVDDKHLLLLDADGKTRYAWRRAGARGEN